VTVLTGRHLTYGPAITRTTILGLVHSGSNHLREKSSTTEYSEDKRMREGEPRPWFWSLKIGITQSEYQETSDGVPPTSPSFIIRFIATDFRSASTTFSAQTQGTY
jgi:hypothetical protein